MHRQNGYPVEMEPRFEAARSRSLWREWPGILALAASLALWISFAAAAVQPLGDGPGWLGATARGAAEPARALLVDHSASSSR